MAKIEVHGKQASHVAVLGRDDSGLDQVSVGYTCDLAEVEPTGRPWLVISVIAMVVAGVLIGLGMWL